MVTFSLSDIISRVTSNNLFGFMQHPFPFFIILCVNRYLFLPVGYIVDGLILCRIEEKIHQFWKDADFGYVKSVQDSRQFVCKPKENQVRKFFFFY